MSEKPDYILRRAQAEDALQIFEIEKACFPDPWSLESIRFEMNENKNAFYVVAEYDKRIIGYAGLWCIFDEGHITNVAVLPEFRQCHVGTGILLELLERTSRMGISHHTLEVRPSNEAGLRLYEKLGFGVEGRRKKYYADNGEDALIMWRHDPASP